MSIFNSVFTSGINVGPFFACIGTAIITGVILAFLGWIKSDSSKGFFITTALLPVSVAMVIILVNGNVGTGVAVAGAFSLIRFRSAPGTAKEIGSIFIAMASGLAFGIGYLAYGVIFAIVAGILLLVFSSLNIWEKRTDTKEVVLRITIPENLDYVTCFNDLMQKYTSKFDVFKVKTVNMGSMFRIYYNATLKDVAQEKEFIDEIRTRNGNLEVVIERPSFGSSEL